MKSDGSDEFSVYGEILKYSVKYEMHMVYYTVNPCACIICHETIVCHDLLHNESLCIYYLPWDHCLSWFITQWILVHILSAMRPLFVMIYYTMNPCAYIICHETIACHDLLHSESLCMYYLSWDHCLSWFITQWILVHVLSAVRPLFNMIYCTVNPCACIICPETIVCHDLLHSESLCMYYLSWDHCLSWFITPWILVHVLSAMRSLFGMIYPGLLMEMRGTREEDCSIRCQGTWHYVSIKAINLSVSWYSSIIFSVNLPWSYWVLLGNKFDYGTWRRQLHISRIKFKKIMLQIL